MKLYWVAQIFMWLCVAGAFASIGTQAWNYFFAGFIISVIGWFIALMLIFWMQS